MEDILARHRRETEELQSKITSKLKNASRKTRKGVRGECATLEADLKSRQIAELEVFRGGAAPENAPRESTEDVTPSEILPSSNAASDLDAYESSQREFRTPIETPESLKDRPEKPTKRNRQRERLARRAAERETIALQAREEASTLPDLRRKEREVLLAKFNQRKLQERPIAANGHCLYSAVADQLLQLHMDLDPTAIRSIPNSLIRKDLGQEDYKIIRKVVADYILDKSDTFLPFLEEPLESYVEKVRSSAEWGGQLELTAIANAYGIKIHVLQAEGQMETIFGTATDTTGRDTWLAYYRHGFGLGEHYNSLHVISDP